MTAADPGTVRRIDRKISPDYLAESAATALLGINP